MVARSTPKASGAAFRLAKLGNRGWKSGSEWVIPAVTCPQAGAVGNASILRAAATVIIKVMGSTGDGTRPHRS